MPFSLSAGLWEVRVALPTKKDARVLFCVAEGSMVLLHGFIKKSQKTPQADLGVARSNEDLEAVNSAALKVAYGGMKR